MKKLMLAAVIAASVSPLSHAYQVEVEGNYVTGTVEYDDSEFKVDADTDNVMLKGSFFLEEVDASKGPLAEAAFLSKASSASFSLNRGETDVEGVTVENDSWSLSAHVVASDKFIIEAEYIDSIQSPEAVSIDLETKSLSLGFGAYLSDTSTFVVSLLSQESEVEGIDVSDDAGISGALKFFLPLADGEALSVGGDLSFIETNVNGSSTTSETVGLTVFADYYLSKQLALKSEFARTSTEEDGRTYEYTRDLNVLTLGAEYFANNQVSLYGNLGFLVGESEEKDLTDIESLDLAGNAVTFGIKGRF